ncbi:hypothetical protein [Acidipropionibacterium virtanenii]|uniref:Cellulose synthase n=1 Tax=Acidipropionibacterium virtanenii TaxID=2057246 RepID=A0A344UTF8_9ACTN|nr:hypothetical protein [Acidipropionibacterium virtanenii]AXE38556.1 hypothetical protein JS278_01382 [Acidipropionibacterium virtanenii]
MADTTLTIVVSTVLIVLPLIWGALRWMRRRSARSLVRSIGLALVPAGLWLIGVMGMVTQWLHQAAHWVRITRMDQTRWIGVAAAGVGIIAIIAGSFIAPVTRQQARERRKGSAPEAAATRRREVGQKASGAPAPAPAGKPQAGGKQAAKKPTGNPDKAGFTDEDRELMELLKERGID